MSHDTFIWYSPKANAFLESCDQVEFEQLSSIRLSTPEHIYNVTQNIKPNVKWIFQKWNQDWKILILLSIN